MKTIKPIAIVKTGNTSIIHTAPSTSHKRIGKYDLPSNVHFEEAMIRFGFTLLIPMLMLGIDKHLIIYTAPIIAYLFITALARFCVVKYIWQRCIKPGQAAVVPAYGEDPDYPEESVE
jgi:hypothetical protein